MAQADADETVLRLSLDAKASVGVGDYSRGGQARVMVKAADHDFQPTAKLIPFGIFLPQYDRLYLYFTASKLTSDFMVDCRGLLETAAPGICPRQDAGVEFG